MIRSEKPANYLENITGDERKKNSSGLMVSLNMLIEKGAGFDYTFKDFTEWAKHDRI